MVTDASGVIVSELRYSAFGETRYQNGTLTTDYLYTGQLQEADIGLYYYVARWYDPAIGRFIQADSIVPDPGEAVGFDRYAYVNNNPIKFNDPSGHCPWCISAAAGAIVGGIVGTVIYALNANASGQQFDVSEAFVAAGAGAVAGGLIGSGLGMLSAGTVGGLVAVTGTASVSEVAAVTISTGAGIGSSGLGYMGGNIITGSDFDSWDYVISTSAGAITGGTGPIIGTTGTTSALLNGSVSLTEYGLSSINHNNDIDFRGLLISGAWGGALGYAQPNIPISDIDLTSSHITAPFHRMDPKFISNKGIVLENLFGKPTLRNAIRTIGTMSLDEFQPADFLEYLME